MPLSSLVSEHPLRIRLIRAGDADGLGFAGLFHVLSRAAAELGRERLQLDVAVPQQRPEQGVHLLLIVADEDVPPESASALLEQCRQARLYGVVGGAADWLRERRELNNDIGTLYDLEQNPFRCCGGAAAIDFALALVKILFGDTLQAEIMEALCVTQVRAPDEPRPQARGRLQPVLAEALRLMETHVEEPLNTDDVANLVGISRRQLERLFKQHLGTMPARYYLELRLRRSRNLLLESHHSIVQVGLMCGFSSAAHFSTAYRALFGMTPREERQRKLVSARI